MLDNAPEIAAENFVEICIQDAKIEDLYDVVANKVQLSFFLMKLLNEFKHQEVSNAVETQRHEKNITSGFKNSPDGYRSPLVKAENYGEQRLRPSGSGSVRPTT